MSTAQNETRLEMNGGADRDSDASEQVLTEDEENMLLFIMETWSTTRDCALAQLKLAREEFPGAWELFDLTESERYYGETFQEFHELSHRPRLSRATEGGPVAARNRALELTCAVLVQKLEWIRPTLEQ